MQVKNVIDNLIRHVGIQQEAIKGLDSAISSYIEFKGDGEKWSTWLKQNQKEENAKSNETSPKGNKQPKGGKR